MLPRCARALETGYTAFTMDLVYGHHLGDRRATQEMRFESVEIFRNRSLTNIM